MKFLTTFIFSFLYLFTFSQNKDTILITPGHPILKANKLKNYTSAYELIRIKDGQEQKMGSLEEEFKIINSNQGLESIRVCKISFGQNTILDSGLCKLESLQPIYHRSLQTHKKMMFDFTNSNIKGFVINLDSTHHNIDSIDNKFSQPLFDSYYEDILAKSFQYKTGLLFKFPEFIYERGGEVWSSGKIIGSEILIDKKGNQLKAWRVKFFELNPKGEVVRETTYLISDKDRSILSREYKIGSNIILLRQAS